MCRVIVGSDNYDLSPKETWQNTYEKSDAETLEKIGYTVVTIEPLSLPLKIEPIYPEIYTNYQTSKV